MERKAFGKLKKLIKKEGVDAPVVTNLDRFARDPRDVISEMDWLKDREVDFVFIDQSIVSSTTAGEMVMVFISYLNRMEREETVEKVKKSLERKKEKGEPLGRPPYGLKYSEDKSNLVPDNEFDQAISVIEKRERGFSLSKIEDITGIPSSTISRILKRKEIYMKKESKK